MSNIPNAITNDICDNLSEIHNLSFLDISFATKVTDEGLHHFTGKHRPIIQLFVNGLTSITSVGFTNLIKTCTGSLKILEAAFMDQEHMTGAMCHPISHAFELQELDLTGNSNVSDDGVIQLVKGERRNEELRINEVIGLPRLRVLKLGGISKMTDTPAIKLAQTSKVLEHLELTKCELLTEYSLENIIRSVTSLKYLDLNGIPIVTPTVLDNLR